MKGAYVPMKGARASVPMKGAFVPMKGARASVPMKGAFVPMKGARASVPMKGAGAYVPMKGAYVPMQLGGRRQSGRACRCRRACGCAVVPSLGKRRLKLDVDPCQGQQEEEKGEVMHAAGAGDCQ
jgi:hypothetical protein